MLVYLSDDFEGGATCFDDSYSDEPFDEFCVTPELGMALFFVHETHHRGDLVTGGLKYVLRTDIMFSSLDRVDPLDPHDVDRDDGHHDLPDDFDDSSAW